MKSKWVGLAIRERREGFRDPLLREVTEEPLDHVFVNEPVLLDILSRYREKDDRGVTDYLLGTFYYTAARKDDALACFRNAHAKGLRYAVLLYNLGYLYWNYKKDPAAAERFFTEAADAGDEGALLWLDRIYAEQGRLEQRRELAPRMERAANKPLFLTALVHIYADCGEEDKALHVLNTNDFENWEGQEASGQAYRKVIQQLALKALEAGDAAAAKRWIDSVQNYPAGLNYGDSALTALADMHYVKGLIYSKLGMEREAAASFARGAAELGGGLTAAAELSRHYGMLCLEQLKKMG